RAENIAICEKCSIVTRPRRAEPHRHVVERESCCECLCSQLRRGRHTRDHPRLAAFNSRDEPPAVVPQLDKSHGSPRISYSLPLGLSYAHLQQLSFPARPKRDREPCTAEVEQNLLRRRLT